MENSKKELLVKILFKQFENFQVVSNLCQNQMTNYQHKSSYVSEMNLLWNLNTLKQYIQEIEETFNSLNQ